MMMISCIVVLYVYIYIYIYIVYPEVFQEYILSSAQTGTLYYNKTETDNMSSSYNTGSYAEYTFLQ